VLLALHPRAYGACSHLTFTAFDPLQLLAASSQISRWISGAPYCAWSVAPANLGALSASLRSRTALANPLYDHLYGGYIDATCQIPCRSAQNWLCI